MKNNNKLYLLFFIFFGTILFYLPLIARQFIADDWIWLANAKLALIDPLHYFSRAMFGYFRPLNMMFHSLMISIFGVYPTAWGALSILLHSTNIVLLWFLLKKMSSNNIFIYSALIIFGFYCLDYSAIGWISVNHDLFATGLSLLFAIVMVNFSDCPNLWRLVALLCLGTAATFFKEFGFVTIGIYFFMLFLYGKSPFSGRFLRYSIIMIGCYSLYIILYVFTTGYTDQNIILNWQVITNLWFFIIYLFFPTPQKAINLIPENLLTYYGIFKVVLTFFIPVMFAYLFWKGNKAVRLFIAWIIMYLAPISLFNLHVKLFDLSVNTTIARYMYCAVPGYSVVIAMIISKVFSNKGKVGSFFLIALLLLYIGGNWLIIKESSKTYYSARKLYTDIVNSVDSIRDKLMEANNIYILKNDEVMGNINLYRGIYLEGLVYTLCEKKIDISLISKTKVETSYGQDDAIVLYYLNSEVSDKCLIPLEKEAGIYPAYYEK